MDFNCLPLRARAGGDRSGRSVLDKDVCEPDETMNEDVEDVEDAEDAGRGGGGVMSACAAEAVSAATAAMGAAVFGAALLLDRLEIDVPADSRL